MRIKVTINNTELNSYKVIQHLNEVYGDEVASSQLPASEDKTSTQLDKFSQPEIINTMSNPQLVAKEAQSSVACDLRSDCMQPDSN